MWAPAPAINERFPSNKTPCWPQSPTLCHTSVLASSHTLEGRDVRIGVLEPLPIGDPTDWCSPMVSCPKANGDPRRTVDLQALNNVSVCQTHTAESSFHQALSVPKQTRQWLMPGKVIIQCHWLRRTDTSPPSLPPGINLDTGHAHKDSWHLGMPSMQDITRWYLTLKTWLNV